MPNEPPFQHSTIMPNVGSVAPAVESAAEVSMSRILRRVLVALAVAGVACSIPTDACGCSPARTSVYVIGTLVDAAGTSVVGARLAFDGVATTGPGSDFALYVGTGSDAQTDGSGAFRGMAYSTFAPGALQLRVGVIRPATADTFRLSAGTATFRLDRPDTVRVALRLP
jgi:hypothetical protein